MSVAGPVGPAVDEEINIPGVLGGFPEGSELSEGEGPGFPGLQIGAGLGSNANPSEENQEDIESDDEDLEDVEETIAERLVGLTEMLPDRFWELFGRMTRGTYWFVRRSAWVIGTSMAILVLPSFLEQQRLEFEEMQSMQKKQMLLGPGSQGMAPPIHGPR